MQNCPGAKGRTKIVAKAPKLKSASVPPVSTTYLDFDAIPREHYGVIYIDPPWQFLCWSEKGTGRSAERHYRTMSFEQLAAFPIMDLAAPRCALFLWVVRNHLDTAVRLIEAWGFTLKTTAFVWAKTCSARPDRFRIGHGKTGTRSGSEQCWIAIRGRKNPKRKSAAVRELIVAPIGRHSEKPAEVRDRIEQLFDGPYLELFARQAAPHWDAWGDQIA